MKKNAKITLETEKEHFIENVIIEEKNALIFIKDLRKNIEMKLKSVKTNITEKEITISYILEDENYLYKIEMED